MAYKDPARKRAYDDAWRERNRERYNAKHREWRADNLEVARANGRDGYHRKMKHDASELGTRLLDADVHRADLPPA